jgi:hypothetical protein
MFDASFSFIGKNCMPVAFASQAIPDSEFLTGDGKKRAFIFYQALS